MEYLGNCVDSFDDMGDCINPALPWSDINGFACAVDEGDNITVENIKIVYDEDSDVHSFYRITA